LHAQNVDGWQRVPLCWCSELFRGTTVHIVSGPEECRRLEERLKSEISELVVCSYEDHSMTPCPHP
jgi:hypothetical protein